MIGNQIDIFFHGRTAALRRRRADSLILSIFSGRTHGLLHDHYRERPSARGSSMTEIVAPGPGDLRRAPPIRRFLWDWARNPWGKPRFLVLVTWVYVLVFHHAGVWWPFSFRFNSGRSVTAWQGFFSDPAGIGAIRSIRSGTILHSQSTLFQSLKLAGAGYADRHAVGCHSLLFGSGPLARGRPRDHRISLCCSRW